MADSKSWTRVESLSEALRFLSKPEHEGKLLGFYNLGFDAQAILKLDRRVLPAFLEGYSRVKYGGYVLSYIQGKWLRIRDEANDASFNYYDFMQYNKGGLDYAAEAVLGLEPDALKKDRARLFELYDDATIGAYCQRDAWKAKRLTEVFLDGMKKDLNFKPKSLLSPGLLATHYVLLNAPKMPKMFDVPLEVNKLYWEAYQGADYECFQKGFLEDAWSYDMNSAYPWSLSTIPDFRKGFWVQEYAKEGSMGVFEVLAKSKEGRHDYLPLAGYASKNLKVHPFLDEWARMTITKGELDAYSTHYDFKVLKGFTWVPKGEESQPYKEIVEKLYSYKQSKKDNPAAYLAAKPIINSLYGTTAQRTGKNSIGRLFNPLMACETTARPKVKVFGDLKGEFGKIATLDNDGVLANEELGLETGLGLGEWSVKFKSKEAVVIRNGVMQVRGERPKTKGFNGKKEVGSSLVLVDLFKALNTSRTVLRVPHFAPKHYRKAIQDKDFEGIGVFETTYSDIDLNQDWKRLFEPILEGKDLLKGVFESSPLSFSMFS